MLTYSRDVFGDRSIVDEGVVVEEESAGDIKRNKDVDAVVLMGSQDKEDPEAVAQPSKGVEEEDAPGGVLRDEEVEESEGHSVAGEHVVPARPHALQAQAGPGPDDVGLDRRPNLV